jgi:hypothetical protein
MAEHPVWDLFYFQIILFVTEASFWGILFCGCIIKVPFSIIKGTEFSNYFLPVAAMAVIDVIAVIAVVATVATVATKATRPPWLPSPEGPAPIDCDTISGIEGATGCCAAAWGLGC